MRRRTEPAGAYHADQPRFRLAASATGGASAQRPLKNYIILLNDLDTEIQKAHNLACIERIEFLQVVDMVVKW